MDFTKIGLLKMCLIVGGVVVTMTSLSVSGVMTSRACFGSAGVLCIRHTLGPCQQNLSIEIIDAYFIGNRGCPVIGVTNCDGLNLTDTYGPHQNLSKRQTDMFNVCLNKSSCKVYPAPRTSTNSFSVIEYICTEGHSSAANISKEATTTVFTQTVNRNRRTNASSGFTVQTTTILAVNADRVNVGAVVGGVLAAVVVVVVVLLVSVWYFRKRRFREKLSEKVDDQRRMKKNFKPESVYSLAGNGNLQKHQYNEVCLGSSMKKGHIDGDPVQEYTYAVVNTPKKPTAKNGGINVDSSDYDIAGDVGNKPISQDVEDTYDHTPSTGNVNFPAGRTTTDTYDTALASSGRPHNTNTHAESNYNHVSLANAKKEFVLSNDYDTTAGALKYGQDESDYDHAHANGEVVGDLDYDTADNVQGFAS